ncbi:hypothetical protein M885DRAFT_610141 [Pelagophyceae sp. CCMP2097]|nr:hypothetical protein M885DRAFT_610141 [Pelagophyceae sp. CCMP2097]
MPVVIFGASGCCGIEAVVQGDLADSAAVSAAVQGASAVLFLAGGPVDRKYQGGFLLPVLEGLVSAMIEHKVGRLFVQLGALCVAPAAMMPNEELGPLKRYVLRGIVSPYLSPFHGCHVDNDAAMDYFAALPADLPLQWTLTRPTALLPEEGGFGDGPSRGALVAAEYLALPSENGATFCDVGALYAAALEQDDPKWFCKAPHLRYARKDDSDGPASACNLM